MQHIEKSRTCTHSHHNKYGAWPTDYYYNNSHAHLCISTWSP